MWPGKVGESTQNTAHISSAAPGLSCSTWDFQASLQHTAALVAVCELLVVECGL